MLQEIDNAQLRKELGLDIKDDEDEELELSDDEDDDEDDEDGLSDEERSQLLAELAESEARSQKEKETGIKHSYISEGKEVFRPEISDSLIRDAMAGKTREEKIAILNTALTAGLEKNDPLFAVLIATGQLEVLLYKKPEELKEFFASCRQGVQEDIETGKAFISQSIDEAIRGLDAQAAAAVKVQQRSIASATSTLVKQAALEKISYDIYALIKGGLVTLAAVGVGVVLGLAIPSFQAQPQLDPSGPRQLTLQEAIALDWALSKEGQYARQFMKWNQTLLGGKNRRVCSSEVSRLGVTLTLEGREAVNGFCTLWVEPPENRQYVE